MAPKRRPPTKEEVRKYWSDIKVERIGDRLVSARPSNDTVSAVASDYREVSWQLRQIATVAAQKRQDHEVYTARDARRDFAGKRVLDFADDKDLEGAMNGQSPTLLAQGMIARVLNLSPETVLRYDKLARKKNSRKSKS